MARNAEGLSRTKAVAIKTLPLALTILKENGGEMRGRDVLVEMEKRTSFDEWERGIYTKTGYVKWRSIFHFYSINLIKAGFLIKKKGLWYLTPEGEKATSFSPEKLFDVIGNAYRLWREQNPKVEDPGEDADSEIAVGEVSNRADVTLDEMQTHERDGITAYINALNPYEFQDLCAALLRGMGYHTPFVAPKGRDGGIDIIAYRDPLGTSIPRMKVQIKHRESSASAPEIHQLLGILRGDGDVGIFISSGGFTSDARGAARNSRVHIELIDLERFIELWTQFYPKLIDEDKNRLPLLPVYFLAPGE